MINIGQLVREKKGIQNTVLVGFSTYRGTVIAAEEWGAKMERMDVPKAREGSWDNLLHFIDSNNKNSDEIGKDKLIIFSDKYKNNNNNKDNKIYWKTMGQRAIGVVYNPQYEKYGNYVPTILSNRYDVLLFIDKTNSLSPLHMRSIEDKDLPETFPTGI
jgi:erythromycin esterase